MAFHQSSRVLQRFIPLSLHGIHRNGARCFAVQIVLMVLLGYLLKTYNQLTSFFIAELSFPASHSKSFYSSNGNRDIRTISENNRSKLEKEALQLFTFPESFQRHKFPRWGEDDKNEGINLPSLMDFMDGIVNQSVDVGNYADALVYIWGAEDPNGAINGTTGGGGLWVADELRSRTMKNPYRYRMIPRLTAVEEALQRAWTHLRHHANDTSARERWPLLLRTMEEGHAEGGGGFPVILWHADFRGCNRFNYKRNISVPLLTTCAKVSCSHAIPFPSYRTVRDSLPELKDWDSLFDRQSLTSSWSNKRRQVVWRGSLTGPTPRIRLGIFAANHRSNPMIDIGIHRIPGNKTFSNELLQQILMKPPIPAANFSSYMAILDTDGNSWSARFGKLLCTNSVILKVEPEYVDYFYKHLIPWKHYVPIKLDLSDLLEKIEWVLDVPNEGQALQIVASANDWCRSHMTHTGVMLDMLDVLNIYLSFLDRDDATWMDVWKTNLARLWDSASGFGMKRIA